MEKNSGCHACIQCRKDSKSNLCDIPFDIVDDVILVDDKSDDDTFSISKNIGIKNVLQHPKNLGYGGNQKTCYKKH